MAQAQKAMPAPEIDLSIDHSAVLKRWLDLQARSRSIHPVIADDRAKRYIWYVGEDIPHGEIPGGWIERGRVTPVLALPMWERLMDVPLELRLDFRGLQPNGEYEEAKYEIQPGGIFNSIMEQYGYWGVIELRALYDKSLEEMIPLNIDGIFCPWLKSRDLGVDEIPKPYRVVREHIMRVADNLSADSRRDILTKVAEDMLRSIDLSKAFDEALVDQEEGGKDPKYTRHGLRALSRLERRRRDAALNDMAATQNQVFGKIPEILVAQQNQGNSDITALIELQSEQNQLLREELALHRKGIEMLLLERAGKQTAEPEAPKTPTPEAPKTAPKR